MVLTVYGLLMEMVKKYTDISFTKGSTSIDTSDTWRGIGNRGLITYYIKDLAGNTTTVEKHNTTIVENDCECDNSCGSSEPEYSTDPAVCSPWHNGSSAGYSCSNAIWACSYRVTNPGETSYSDCVAWGGTEKTGDDENNISSNSYWEPGAKLPAYCVVAKSPSGLYSVYCTSNTNQYHESTGTTSDAGCSIEYIKASDCIDDCDDNGLCESFDHQPTSCGVNISGC